MSSMKRTLTGLAITALILIAAAPTAVANASVDPATPATEVEAVVGGGRSGDITITAGYDVTCPGNNVTCVNSFYHGVVGTVSIDADIYGTSSTVYQWILVRPNGTTHCYGDVKPSDPARSWTCANVGVGQHQLRMWTAMNGGRLGHRY